MIRYELPTALYSYLDLYNGDRFVVCIRVNSLDTDHDILASLHRWGNILGTTFNMEEALTACRIARDELSDKGEEWLW